MRAAGQLLTDIELYLTADAYTGAWNVYCIFLEAGVCVWRECGYVWQKSGLHYSKMHT